jgi:four helix bundle protein
MAVRSYRDLEIYKLSYSLALEVDKMTRTLPRYEFSEEGSQIRRSSKSIPANIAEGYGRKRYRGEYVRFTVYALSSCDETTVHLDFLHDCGHIDSSTHQHFAEEYDKLGRMIHNFLKAIDAGRSR